MLSLQKVFRPLVLVSMLGSATSGCASKLATLSSDAVNLTGSQSLKSVSSLTTSSADFDEFKICVSRIKLENESGEAAEVDGSNEIKFEPGLIDIKNATETSWGTFDIPSGFKVSKIKVKVKKKKELCGTDYSLRVLKTGDTTAIETEKDFEFKFKFNPAIEIAKGDTLNVSLSTVVNALRTAAATGGSGLDGNSIHTKIEEVEGTARRK